VLGKKETLPSPFSDGKGRLQVVVRLRRFSTSASATDSEQERWGLGVVKKGMTRGKKAKQDRGGLELDSRGGRGVKKILK